MTGTDEHPTDEASVLSSLPGTRPQRRSPKRAVAKPDVAAPAESTPPTSRRPRPPRTRRPAPAADPVVGDTPPEAPDPAARPVAAQGFEADPIEGTVNPPTGAELVASVAQAATELAEIGLSLTRRLARSVLDRLPRL